MISATTGHERTVSVVIPTYNNPRLLAECLYSVRALRYPQAALEIVVADNSSGQETANLLRTRFPEARRVEMGKNTGFAPACNRGASQASGDYVAFLNDDAVAEPGWLEGLFTALDAAGDGAVCAASHIRSQDGREVEYSGASANLFGVGRPRPAWGWPGTLETPGEGSPVLFASGGAMLIHRQTFLDVGGFDPNFFAYFEDVDLGWRLWALGHRVVYAPGAVVRHTGGATGSKAGAHKRYTLWECNSLATVLKNYESGNMERILQAALLLLYRRALLSAGGAFKPEDYRLGAGRDENETNVERLPKVSVAHLAAIDRFNRLLPLFMEERERIQKARTKPDSEILPLLGRAYEPQFAGTTYAHDARLLADALGLYGITAQGAPNHILVLASTAEESEARSLAARLTAQWPVALALVSAPASDDPPVEEGGVVTHRLDEQDPMLLSLIQQADAIVALGSAAKLPALKITGTPVALMGGELSNAGIPGALYLSGPDDPALLNFCRFPQPSTS